MSALALAGAPAHAQDAAAPADPAAAVAPADPVRTELRYRLIGADPELAAFYAARDYAPLWVEGAGRSQAETLLERIRAAADDGLDPATYGPDRLDEALAASGTGEAARLADAELSLSRTLIRYVTDLRQGRGDAKPAFVDPQAPAPATRAPTILDEAARGDAPDVAALTRMNPIYDRFRQALAAQRQRGDDPAAERLLLANLERARVLPADLGERYILVDAAAGRLWFYDRGQVRGGMKVAVGKPSLPTPVMTGLIRYALFNPYWNVPEDLVRTTVARHVLDEGLGYLATEGMIVLSSYEDDAVELDPATLDWQKIHDGEVVVRVRQRPGARNMMGKVKLMLPNPLGIYLHDTPNKAVFAEDARYVSSGCVRLEDALALAELLMGDAARDAAAGDVVETRVELERPVPVYITYFTAMPSGQTLAVRKDIYGRDAPLLAQLGAGTLLAEAAP